MAASAFHSYNPNISSISEAYRTLLPLFGSTAGIVFLVTLLSSGIASSVTGTLAGQAIMEGLLGKKVNIWFRRFVTRFVNVIPTTIAILLGLDPLNILVYSQVILSLMIPLPMIPLVILSSFGIVIISYFPLANTQPESQTLPVLLIHGYKSGPRSME